MENHLLERSTFYIFNTEENLFNKLHANSFTYAVYISCGIKLNP